MGLCCSGSLEQAKSRAIDKQNRQDNASERAKVKLLLLGAGESGKSTIFKQMKLLFGDGFTDEERNDHARVIRSNVLSEIAKLCKALTAFELDGELTPEARDAFNALTDPHFLGPEATGAYKLGFDDALVGHVRRLWADPASEKVWARRSETQLIESNRCFFEKLDEIKDASYLPTDEDIVASRARTSGIIEEKYTIGASGGLLRRPAPFLSHPLSIGGVHFVIIDVGGQRSERRKWMHAFDEVTAVIFVAALSEFDQMMFEDTSANRMVDALELFDKTCNGAVFKNTPIILFLNKSDLFRAKIAETQIATTPAFGDYPGKPHDYDDGIE